jgi:hypothetical protein
VSEKEHDASFALELSPVDERFADVLGGGKSFFEVLEAIGIPVVGLGGLAFGKVLEHRTTNLPDVIRAFDASMAKMMAWIDETYLSSRGAAAFVEEVYAAALRLSEEEKRDYYATALANGLSTHRPPDDDRNRMIDALERLRLPELRLLATARHAPMDIPFGSIVDLSADNGFLQALAPDTPFDRLNMDWQNLRRAGLVENEPILGSEMPGYAKFITGFGLEFDLFVRVPYSDVHPRRESEGNAGAPQPARREPAADQGNEAG